MSKWFTELENNIMRQVILLIMVFSFLFGCSDNNNDQRPPDGSVFSENFIQSYVIPSKIALGNTARGYISVKFIGQEIKNTDMFAKSDYDKLATRYDDLAYNSNLVKNSTCAIGKEYLEIKIFCNKAIDDNHNAGESLNDVVKLCGNSFKEYIASKYDANFKSPTIPSEFEGLDFYNGKGASPVFKLLSEVTANDLILVEPELYLLLPDILESGDYEFTVTVTSSNEILSEKIIVNM